jgi:Peptidase A4 family
MKGINPHGYGLKNLVVVFSAVACLLLVVPAATSVAAATPPTLVKNNQWAGYGIQESFAAGGVPVYATIMTFTQPKITCNSTATFPQVAYVIAAIDGAPAGAPGDFEYVGTEAFCAVGASTPSYSAVSTATSGFINFAVSPGDLLYANVTHESATHFVYFISDLTSAKAAVGISPSSSPALTAAECVVYRPNPLPSGSPALLAKFGTVAIGFGKPRTFGCIEYLSENSGSGMTLIKYDMTNTAMTTIIASPGALGKNQGNFKVHWHGYGP